MRWFNKQIESWLSSAIFAGIITGGVAMWSLISNLPKPIIAVMAIATFAAIVTVLNQFNIWQERRKSRISALSDQELEDTILKWIHIDNFAVTKRANLPNILFTFLVTDQHNLSAEVTRTTSEKYQLSVGLNLKLSEEQEGKVNALGSDKGSELVRNIRLEMIRFGIGFENITLPFPKQFTLSHIISLDDSLTKVDLTQAMLFVRQAQVLIAELINQRLGVIK